MREQERSRKEGEGSRKREKVSCEGKDGSRGKKEGMGIGVWGAEEVSDERDR